MKIKKEIIERVFVQAVEGLPNEICGFFAGKDGLVQKHYELKNLDASPEHFSMDPKEQMAAVKDMRAEGFQLMACYHSHPSTPARPSDEDMRLAFDPNLSYVIVSLKEEKPDIKSYRIKGTDVELEELKII